MTKIKRKSKNSRTNKVNKQFSTGTMISEKQKYEENHMIIYFITAQKTKTGVIISLAGTGTAESGQLKAVCPSDIVTQLNSIFERCKTDYMVFLLDDILVPETVDDIWNTLRDEIREFIQKPCGVTLGPATLATE